MKKMLLSTALAACFAMPVLAQDAPVSPFQSEASGPSVSASQVIGARIYASEAALDGDAFAGVQDGWDDIGEVDDVILTRDGTVDAVMVDIGGFLGIGERRVAVDMSALRFVQDSATDADDWFLVLQADRATLEGAPEWVMPSAAMTTDTTADTTATTETDTATDTTTATAEAPAATTEADAKVATTTGMTTLPEGYVAVEADKLTAEMLTGANVHDAEDKSVAEIKDLVMTSDGKVTDVVLDVGGFLGIGAKTVAIPMDRLTVAQKEDGKVALWVNMAKEELEALPDYKD